MTVARIARMYVSAELLGEIQIQAMLPRSVKIVGSFECLDRRTVALAVETTVPISGSALEVIVRDEGLSRVVEVREVAGPPRKTVADSDGDDGS